MSLKEIKNRNIYLTVQDWPQAPVTTSDEAPQVDEEQKADTQDDFFGFSLDALEHDPVLNRQVNVFRKVYFRSERIADKTSMACSRKTVVCPFGQTDFARIET